MSRRRVTVYDAAALRLHRDGSRITESNKRKRVIDSHGNPIAVDAVGKLPGVKKSKPRKAEGAKKGKERELEDEEYDELEMIDAPDDEENFPSSSKVKRKRTTIQEGRHRDTIKRAKFDNQFEFISNNLSMAGSSTPARGMTPLPESDFLKTIHYLASHYYDSRNLLLDLFHEQYAQKQKQKRQKEEQSSSDGASDAVEDGEEPSEQKSSGRKSNGHRPEKYRQDWQKDMYRAFSGDMLIALGIVLQEDIIFQLRKRAPPDGWGEMTEVGEEYYDDSDGQDQQPHDFSADSSGNLATDPSDSEEDDAADEGMNEEDESTEEKE
ncbi:hypothetical protein FRC03_007972 [Tulasnella sp. 419]|nr:hypothetical protein FRC03_007972 [Tulasnella sp. 419]